MHGHVCSWVYAVRFYQRKGMPNKHYFQTPFGSQFWSPGSLKCRPLIPTVYFSPTWEELYLFIECNRFMECPVSLKVLSQQKSASCGGTTFYAMPVHLFTLNTVL